MRADRCNAAGISAPLIEPLEPRRMFAGGLAEFETDGPAVVGERLVGSPRLVSGVVLTFDQPLDPVAASDPRNYGISRTRTEVRSRTDSFTGESRREVVSDRDRIGVLSAAYDPATRSVTVTPEGRFALLRNKRLYSLRVRVEGGPGGVRNEAGVPLNGASDRRAGPGVLLQFQFKSGKSLSYRDADGDRVGFRVRGPGKLFLQLRREDKNPAGGQLFVLDADPASSVLTGRVRPAKRGDGVVPLQELAGADAVRPDALAALLDDPRFRVGSARPLQDEVIST